MLYESLYKSPIGTLKLVASGKGLVAITHENKFESVTQECSNNKIIQQTKKQLDEYFAGKRQDFSVTLDLQGTGFQKQVWQALMHIPYGKTISYGELAKGINNPKAVRAVGGANNKNPVSVIVPCHRVIGANGKLVGYAGGLNKKEYLLSLENKGVMK